MIDQEDYLRFLNHLQSIISLKESCRPLSEDKKYSHDDVRNTYYRQVMNVINDYYLGMIGPFFMNRIKDPLGNGTIAQYLPCAIENELFSNLGFLCSFSYLKTWHDMKKVGLVFSLWIVFEDSIDIIYQNIATESEIEKYKNGTFNRIKKIIEGKLIDEDIQSIQEKLKSDYIGINNKYNYILNFLTLDKNQKKKVKEIRDFLQFFNILRNSLHTNSRPMKNYEFKLSIGTFKFEKNKHIDFFTLDVLYNSINEFVKIFSFLRENLDIEKEMFNTASLVENSYTGTDL
ncbi:hypothetical protein [Flavobacterium sp. GSA192]|uniref:hypothetical protein n=1 Tax=Flavobacterium sp. GSA192 TaxID=2576304 RepID=UPI00112A48A8|nr:hypothetical protein [Flavobacterium sp. GSA192]